MSKTPLKYKAEKCHKCGTLRKNQCILCGGYSPNCFGECLCSYDLVMLSGDYKKISERLADVVRNLMKIKWGI